MFPQHFSASRVLALMAMAALVLLGVSGTTSAQPEQLYFDSNGYWRYSNGNWYHYKSYHGYNPGYYARPDRVLPHGVSPGHVGAYSDPSRDPKGSWKLPTSSQPPNKSSPTGMPVHIEVRLPADAEFWFFDTKTTQTGPLRRFVSPPLIPGYDYTYEVRSRWKQDGREVTQRRRITVHAGDRVSTTFSAAPAVKTKEP